MQIAWAHRNNNITAYRPIRRPLAIRWHSNGNPHNRNGKKIDQAFSVSYTWVEAFRKENGRLPEQREFDAWAGALQDETNWVKHIGVLSKPSQYPSESTEAFGNAPDGAYVLELWRGEWTEYFASWRMKSTVDGAFGLFGYLILIALLLFGVAAGIRYVSLKYCRTE